MSQAAPQIPEVQVSQNLDGGAIVPTENNVDLSGGKKKRKRRVHGGAMLEGGGRRRSRSRSRSRRSRRRMGGGEAETSSISGGRMRNMRSMGGMYGMGMYGGETPELQGGRRRRY